MSGPFWCSPNRTCLILLLGKDVEEVSCCSGRSTSLSPAPFLPSQSFQPHSVLTTTSFRLPQHQGGRLPLPFKVSRVMERRWFLYPIQRVLLPKLLCSLQPLGTSPLSLSCLGPPAPLPGRGFLPCSLLLYSHPNNRFCLLHGQQLELADLCCVHLHVVLLSRNALALLLPQLC